MCKSIWTAVALVSLAILMVFAAGGCSAGTPTATPVPSIEVRIAWQPSNSFLFYTARDLKLFEKAGLRPEYVKFVAILPQYDALRADSIDIGSFGTAAMVVGTSQGLDYENFYIQVQSSYSDGLVVRKDSGITSIADLKGKKIAYAKGTSSHLGLSQTLAKNKLTFTDVQAVAMDAAVMVPAFSNNDIVAAYAWEPWISKMEAAGGRTIIRTHDVGLYTADHWVVRKAWAKDNPEGMRRLLYALDLATDEFKRDPSQAIKATADNLNVDEATARHIMETTPITTFEQLNDPKFELSLVSPDGAQSMIQGVGNFLFAQQITQRRINAANLVNGSYLQQYMANRPKK